jgi:hypothetical protein
MLALAAVRTVHGALQPRRRETSSAGPSGGIPGDVIDENVPACTW